MTLRANLSDQPLLCAAQAALVLAQRQLPVPQEFQRANALLNPRGRAPARGWLLMKRKHAEKLDKTARHTLTFRDGDRTLALKGLVYVTSRCLTVGAAVKDPESAHLVEVADERWLWVNPLYQHSLNAQYNVVAPDYRAAEDLDRWVSATCDGTQPWTWRGMLTDLWGRLPAGAPPCPDLELVPDLLEPYRPQNWRFVGCSVWGALCDLLEYLSLALAVDLTAAPDAAGRFRVVDPGTADAAMDRLHRDAAGKGSLLYQNDALDNSRARLPQRVHVYSPAPPRHHGGERATGDVSDQWQGAPARLVAAIANPYDNGQEGVNHALWSDFEIQILADGAMRPGDDGYGCAGKAELWAQQLATGYFRTLHAGGTPLVQRIYLGAWSFQTGSMASGVAWRQGDWKGQPALLTEVVRGPGPPVRVGDEGAFDPFDPNHPAQAPTLGPGFPVYPPHLQILGPATGTGISLRVVTGTGVGVDDMAVYQYDAQAGALIKREAVWARALPEGYTQGRIVGYEGGRPVYVTGTGEPNPCGGDGRRVVTIVTGLCARQS